MAIAFTLHTVPFVPKGDKRRQKASGDLGSGYLLCFIITWPSFLPWRLMSLSLCLRFLWGWLPATHFASHQGGPRALYLQSWRGCLQQMQVCQVSSSLLQAILAGSLRK